MENSVYKLLKAILVVDVEKNIETKKDVVVYRKPYGNDILWIGQKFLN